MAITQKPTFKGEIEAAAINLDGFTLADWFEPEIEDYRRQETVLWRLIRPENKKKARAATVRHVKRDKIQSVGFVSRSDLSGRSINDKQDGDMDLNIDDPGQDIKALAGSARFPHFSRSLAIQQGHPYGDEVAENTASLIQDTYRALELALYRGNATANPLEFNGILRQMPAQGQVEEVDLTGETPEKIWRMMNLICVKAATNRTINRRITHFLFSGAALVKLQEEVVVDSLKMNQLEIIPGVHVDTIQTGDGQKPIIVSPFIDDAASLGGDAEADPVVPPDHDMLTIIGIDINALYWYGVIPEGGNASLDPQVFDMNIYQGNRPLVTERMTLMYGTPKVLNDGVWRINIKAPLGSAFNTIATP